MQTLLNVSNLCKNYRRSTGIFTYKQMVAFGPVNFTLERGKTLVLVGESGSGKSSIVKTIVGITKPTSGEIYFKGKALKSIPKKERLKSIRMIFHDPDLSIDSKVSVGTTLLTPLKINTNFTAIEQDRQMKETLRLVGLSTDYLSHYPNMLSTVQLHQVAIARAIILNPEIIIVDEILATLDISLRFKIVNLLLKIQAKKGTSYIFIAHNMNLVRHISDNVIVMSKGLIVESNTAENIYTNPQSAVTKHLLQSYQADYQN